MTTSEGWRSRARALRADTYALYLACRDPRVPWYAKALAGLVVAYALSPIDLIPDFVPVLGYLDDLILIPLGIAAVLRLVPAGVMADCRRQAREATTAGPAGWPGVLVVAGTWLLLAVLAIAVVLHLLGRW